MAEESHRNAVDERSSEIHHREVFEGDGDDPCNRLVETVAELRGVDRTDLRPLYTRVDSLVEDLYSSPPPAKAQPVVEFSYEGYRITLYQDGHAVFMPRSES